MESYIQISKINDFLFCPRSVYLHSIYESFSEKTYHSHYQTAGKIAHCAIDEKTYTSLKKYLIALPIYSTHYNLAGKIDLYDRPSHHLIERKKKVKKIFKGQLYQLYAQMICLEEMGYGVDKISLHSLEDNRRYNISKPNQKELNNFLKVILQMQDCDNKHNFSLQQNLSKCQSCIYRPLCRNDID